MNTEPPSDQPLFSEGQKLAGTYVLRQQISPGGTLSAVWAAEDEVLGKRVSLHLLPAALLGNPTAMDEVRGVVKRTRQLIHPHILRVLDLVEEDTWAAVSMENFAGEPLAQSALAGADCTMGSIRPWLDQLCQTLDEAHAIHFVHGDVSAENVFIDAEGKVILAYFGLGRVVRDALSSNDPSAGEVKQGVSPQILRGEAPTPADDVYAVGALLYKYLTGESPAPEARKSVAEARAAAGKPPLALPAPVETAIAACLSADPGARPGSARAIFQLMEDESAVATPAISPSPAAVVAASEVAAVSEQKIAEAPTSEGKVDVLPASTELVIKSANRPDAGKKSSLDPLVPLPHLKSGGFPGLGLAAAAILIGAGIIAYNVGSRNAKSPPPAAISTTDRPAGTEMVSVTNANPASASAALVASTPAKIDASALSPATPPPMIMAAAKATPAKVAATPAPSSVGEDKAGVLVKAREAAAAADKAREDILKQKQAAEASAAEAQKALDEKVKAAEPARKAAEEAAALRKKKEDEQKAAETAAQQAQQLAAEKARVAEEGRKALADLDAKNKERTTAQEKADAELAALQKKVADRQLAVAEAGKTLAAAEAARQQQGATLQQIEQEVATASARAAAEKAQAAETERKRQAADSERRKLDDELASMRAMFEQKMKEIEARRQQIESGAAPVPAASTPAATPVPTPRATVPPAPAPAAAAAPKATPAPIAMLATPKPTPVSEAALLAGKPEAARTASPVPAGGEFQNSLGMKFAPVGDVNFCVWQTRVKDFEVFAQAVNLKSTAWKAPGFKQAPEHPVVNVSWNEAIAFCKWLTEKERKDGTLTPTQFYRLPYDLEWSTAVGLPEESGKNPETRDMGVPDVYPWGTAWPPPKGSGNYTGEETGSDVAIKGYDDSFPWTSPVGSFPPNQFGLYDMGGNVWQWCMDNWNEESKAKVLRGASWYNGALKLSLLSSCRVHASPDSSTDNYGFRILRATDAPKGKK